MPDEVARFLREAFHEPLRDGGFGRVGRKNIWLRRTEQVVHQVALLRRRGMFTTQWGLFIDKVVPVLWEMSPDSTDIGQAAVTGTPSGLSHPSASASFRTAEVTAGELDVAEVRREITRVATWMARFQTRRDVRQYLLDNRDPTDRREFVVPAKLPLKLLTAAALAVADGDEHAPVLVEEATSALATFHGPLTAGRLARLRRAESG